MILNNFLTRMNNYVSEKLDPSTLHKNTTNLIATRYHKESGSFQNSSASANKWSGDAEFIINLQIHCDLAGGIFNGPESYSEKLDEQNSQWQGYYYCNTERELKLLWLQIVNEHLYVQGTVKRADHFISLELSWCQKRNFMCWVD